VRAAVIGVGAVGARAARQLVSTDVVTSVVLDDEQSDRASGAAHAMGERAHAARAEPADVDVVVLATPHGTHVDQAKRFVDAGVPVVSTADAPDDVRGLLALDADARDRGVALVVGAGFGPGLSCVLAAHAAARFDEVAEVHVARSGTGGPACARQHHRALSGPSVDWRDGGWLHRPGGSGRELCWFPDPVGPQDCYRAALPDALLLVPAFPGVDRVTARLAANRRDRLTAPLPMLRPPHPEGGPGAVRVEVRGRRDGALDTVVLGAMDRPAVAAGAVVALAAVAAAEGRVPAGAGGLAGRVDALVFLQELARRGVRAAVFEGTPVG
jgi:hypothetical protein